MQRTLLKFLSAACLTPLALSCLSSAQAAEAADVQDVAAPKEIVMFVGEIKSLPANKAYRVAVGNGALVSTKFIEPDQMLLIAEGVGDSSLVMWSPKGEVRSYTLRIGPKDSGMAYRAAKEVLSDITSIQIAPMGPNIAITGAASPTQIVRINALAGRYPQLMSLVKELDVEMKKMVYMKVQILEAKKNLSETLGVSWPGSITGPQVGFSGNLGSTNPAGAAALTASGAAFNLPLTVSGVRTYLGITSSIQSTINLAKANGDLTVLAEPELSARSGGIASFLAGGQIPLQSSGALGTSNITYKDYGIKLTIKPSADDKGNVIAAIKAEMSQLDSSTSVNNNPGFLTRTAETEINVRSGQTMVISGLINRDMQNDVSKVPWLGDLPVLGPLFRSTGFRSGRTDMLIAVTPVVVDPSGSMNQERIEKGLEMKERFERNLSKKDIID